MNHAWVWIALTSIGMLGCSSRSANDERAARAAHQALTGPISFQIQTPHGIPLLSPVLLAGNSVAIGGGSKVAQSPSAAAPIVALGTAGVHTELDAMSSDIWSRGPVDLRDRVRVQGQVHASVVTSALSSVVTGGIDHAPIFDPLSTGTWTVQFPGATGPDAIVEPDQSKAIVAGAFGTVRVNARAQLTLTSGTYFFQSLDLESGSMVRLVQDTGPIIIYVAGNIIYRGTLATSTGAPPDLVVAAVTSATVFVEAPFNGALLVPSGGIEFRQGSYAGFFAAKDIILDAHATVAYRASNALVSVLFPSGTGIQQCADAIQPDLTLTGAAREVAYQTAIARYCTLAGTGTQCSASLIGRGNTDYAAAALQLMHQSIDPAHYLAVVRDRSRKLREARHDATFATLLCKSPDADGDWIPDASDHCPGTPALTATDDVGCPTTTLPDAPSAVDVHSVLTNINLPFRAACANASMPPRTTAGAFYRPAQLEAGVYIFATRAVGQPTGCPVWYEFDIQETGATAVNEYRVAFMDREESTDLVGLGKPVPTRAIQFNPLPTDLGSRGQLGSAGGSSVRFRVRAMNGAGQRSDWSDWRITTMDDCLALGFQCG